VSRELYAGLMSGTSLDGVDAVLADLSGARPALRASVHHGLARALRAELLALNSPGENELERAALAANDLARAYAAAVEELLASSGTPPAQVRAIGCHGQTVRHRPASGYSAQIGNAALLVELTGVTVVADFRSRDIAAGGQGAPLVPPFHAALFGSRAENRAVANIGGIANLSCLPASGEIGGFDCGPGNCLLDLWAARHLGKDFDEAGAWAAGGTVAAALLERLLAEPFFALAPPKSTGRDLFNQAWLDARGVASHDPRSVQATLLELTARTIADACRRHFAGMQRLIVCGGGAKNRALMDRLGALLGPVAAETSAAHGIDPSLVEAAALAWLAKQALDGAPASLPSVTGARGPRILGAIYRR
jgi:anhydro-N-acetylmuramic acid kinase